MRAKIAGGPPRPSTEYIGLLEKRLGIDLPIQYKSFLFEFNGGYVDPCRFFFKGVDGVDNSSVISKFLSVSDESVDDFETNYRFYTENRRIPRTMAPIAYDPGGNLICISLSGADRGAILFWDHELELEKSGRENLAFVAKDLSTFLTKLSDEEVRA